MSCFKFHYFKKIISPKKIRQNVKLTSENLPKEFVDEIKTGNVEKNVLIHMADKTIAV